MKQKTFTVEQAEKLGTQMGIDFDTVDIDEFQRGLSVELEHGTHDSETNVTQDNLVETGKIAWAHLKEIPDYYTRLYIMEREAKRKEPVMKRLYLSKVDKKVFGVCGGIAEYFETDPTLIRLAWIVMTIITGIVPGIIAYLVAAMVVPSHIIEETERPFRGVHSKA